MNERILPPLHWTDQLFAKKEKPAVKDRLIEVASGHWARSRGGSVEAAREVLVKQYGFDESHWRELELKVGP